MGTWGLCPDVFAEGIGQFPTTQLPKTKLSGATPKLRNSQAAQPPSGATPKRRNSQAAQLPSGATPNLSWELGVGSWDLGVWELGRWELIGSWALRSCGVDSVHLMTITVMTSLAMPPLPSLTRTVIGTGPSADGAVHVVCFDAAGAAAPDGALHA